MYTETTHTREYKIYVFLTCSLQENTCFCTVYCPDKHTHNDQGQLRLITKKKRVKIKNEEML